jgi:hypothetical protein
MIAKQASEHNKRFIHRRFLNLFRARREGARKRNVRQKILESKRGRGPAQIPSGLRGVNSRGLVGIFTPYFERSEIVAGPPRPHFHDWQNDCGEGLSFLIFYRARSNFYITTLMLLAPRLAFFRLLFVFIMKTALLALV